MTDVARRAGDGYGSPPGLARAAACEWRLTGGASIGDHRLRRTVERATRAIAEQEWLDVPSYKLEHGFATALNLLRDAGEPVRNVLNGTSLGHPLHPLLTDLPLGAWTASIVLDGLDLVGGRSEEYRTATNVVVATGLAGAAGAAVTGLADWQYTHGKARRTGLVHGLANTVALVLYAGSWRERRAGRHGRGRLLGAAGYLTACTSAYLGGELVFRDRIGVDHADDAPEPRTFTPVLAADDLAEDTPHQVEVGGVDVVLVRHQGTVSAFGAHCPHLGAPLGDGWVDRGDLVCPWHGSRFTLPTGQVVSGPATGPLPCFQARLRDNTIEVRRRPDAPAATPDSVLAYEQEQQRAGF